MKKDLGVLQAVYPMPVLIVAAYDENGTVQLLNAAWGNMCDMNKIALFLDQDHKTTKSILHTKAFTVALASKPTIEVADYVGIATGNKVPDKFARTGYTARKSAHVNAPIIEEFPLVMECELDKVVSDGDFWAIVGKVVNVAAEEATLDEKGKVDVSKLEALAFDNFRNGYYALGDKFAQAWKVGAPLARNK